MELGLSLGDRPKPFSFVDHNNNKRSHQQMKDLGFCMALANNKDEDEEDEKKYELDDKRSCSSSSPPLLQLHLLPLLPSPPPPTTTRRPFPWLSQNWVAETGSQNKPVEGPDVKRSAGVSDPETGEEPAGDDVSSPNNSNSGTSSFQMDFSSIFIKNSGSSSSSMKIRSFQTRKRDVVEIAKANLEIVEFTERERERGGISDEDENGLARKKLRLTKEQSAFLEDSFKEHNTLNPKQKLALAKQLNLRPRQVEVWFQNRRARTKLKQTEVDCEYLKKCCETLSEENKRLQKELQELRALKTSQPFYMQVPATTLTMCPSCERVAATTAATTAASPATTTCRKQPPGGGSGHEH